MANMTATQLATVLKISVTSLLEHFREANIVVNDPTQIITDQAKQALLTHLQSNRRKIPSAPAAKTITLTRKSVIQVRSTRSTAHSKTVNIEVREKRTYVQQVPPSVPTKITEENTALFIEAVPFSPPSQVKITETVVAPIPLPPVLANEAVVKRNVVAPAAPVEKKPAPKKKDKYSKHRGNYTEEDEAEKPVFKPRYYDKSAAAIHGFTAPKAPLVYDVSITKTTTVAELAQKMNVKAGQVIKALLQIGVMATINQVLDQDIAILVAEELGHRAVPLQDNALETLVAEENAAVGEALPRSPVVTIMGHVDHGKTSLLDYIRHTKVAAGEAGGITQHIGAYHVETPKGMLTFLDTPGHEAFTAMRARGAQCTDIVVLIVAADDGVKPQTIEAIKHAKAAKVPIVVAINKIDKPGVEPEKVKTELAQYEVIADGWGGDVMFAEVSAKTGQGVDELLDLILLQAEVLELKAARAGPAKGVVVEARLDKGRGPVATILVQQGTLHKGDIVLAGTQYGRVRALLNENGQFVDTAGPSIPVEVLGLSGTPSAGDDVITVKDERRAKEIAVFRQTKSRELKLARQRTTKLENLFARVAEDAQATLRIVLKASVQGSVEALNDALLNLSTDKIKVDIVASGTGAITESDINLAMASQAVVIGFNVRADTTARRLVESEGIDLRYYSIIYEVLDEIKKAMTGLLAPEFKEQVVGVAQVRDIFRSSKFGTIAGCMVIEGLIKRNSPVRVLRDSVVIFTATLESLKRFKEDASEVRNGMECGIGIKNYSDFKAGDQIEVFEIVQLEAKL